MLLIVSFIVIIIITFIVLVSFASKMMNKDLGTATAHLDQLSAEYAKKEEQIRKQLEDVKRQSQEILANAEKDAALNKQRVLKEAETEKEKVITQAQSKCDEMIQQADRARQALMDDMDHKIEERAIQRASELLKEALPEDIRVTIHGKWIDDLVGGGFDQLERLRIPEGINEAVLTTAYPLTEEKRQALAGKIKEKIGVQINLKEEVDADIISGWVITIGSLILDGSLRFKIQEAAISKQKVI
ncbi:MAG: F0F1 ATP synthase subunit delta [Candidatus Omnitrophica bacterium]|nr:F0F1 ATP synthase subunit delta [Candidatus Omnitrophota bacterium]